MCTRKRSKRRKRKRKRTRKRKRKRVNVTRKRRVHALVDNLDNGLRLGRQKYAYLGVGLHLYLTQAAERSGSSFHVVLSNYKTSYERSGLGVEYPLARFRESNRADWMGILREFLFGIVESTIKKHMIEWAEGSTNTPTKFSGTLLLEMPDRSGIKVFFEGQGGSAGETPSMTFYYHRAENWIGMNMIHSTTDFPREDPFDRKRGFRWTQPENEDSEENGDDDIVDGCVADGPKF